MGWSDSGNPAIFCKCWAYQPSLQLNAIKPPNATYTTKAAPTNWRKHRFSLVLNAAYYGLRRVFMQALNFMLKL